ncbi:MAG: diguanylate cyclase [Lachnospiraceae bacterium]|nr:diguanylate cyclase [Lachnospiraceae bacterium]
MIINISLLMAGSVALTMGVHYLRKDRYLKSWNIYISIMGFFVFLWCAGYAWMGMAEDFSIAYIARHVGLFGVIGFMTTEFFFLVGITNIWKKHIKIIGVGMCVLGVADLLLFSGHNVMTFTRVGQRTCYYANDTFGRTFHSMYLMGLMLLLSWIGYTWYRQVHLKRDKRLVLYIFLVNFCIVFATIPDTFLPLLHKPSVPSSGYGAILAYFVICYMEAKYNAFSVSISNLSKYIYQYVTVPVIVFSHDNTIAFINDYGKRFFGAEQKKSEYLYDFFEVSKEDYKKLFDEIKDQAEIRQSYWMLPLQDGRLCSLNFTCIKDSYGEAYCTICFINDISGEAKKMEELSSMRDKLQKEVSEKSREVERITLQAIATIANALDAKDAYTKGHSVRVAEYSELLARSIGWDDTRVDNLHYIALLHDIGKIGVPDTVLNKPGKLLEIEVELIKSHTTIGGEILKDISLVDHVADGALYHHEQYDGNGYPKGLKGEEIPIEARIICIADAYDAMNTDRVYRKKLPAEVIKNQLANGKGVQFDPDLVDDFLILLSAGKLSSDSIQEASMRHDTERTGLLLQALMEQGRKKKKQIEEKSVDEKGNDERDYLTGVYTRKIGRTYMETAMLKEPGCLAVIDIDNLKRVNNVYGHLAGDHALKILSGILLEHRENAIATRFGGDEFLYYMKAVSKEEAENLIEEISYSFKCRKDMHQSLKRTALSIGLCMSHKGDEYEQIYQNAGKALYNVKQTGKGRYDFYKEIQQSDSNASTADLQRLVTILREAEHYEGASGMEYQELSRVCNFVNRFGRNYASPLQLVMITMQYRMGEEYSLERQEHMMNCMRVAIVDSLGNTKATTQFSSVQHLVILCSDDRNQIKETMNRIFRKFYKMCSDRKADISYDVAEYKVKSEQTK